MRFVRVLLCAALVVLPISSSYGMDPGQMEKFFDGLMGVRPGQPIPGGTCVVVRNGEIFFQKDYGLSSLEQQTPVDADRTVFSTASVTKLFTAVAVMQLIEQGEFSLDTDVNELLVNMRLEPSGFGSVTVEHLLTHTSGLDERFVGIMYRDEQASIPLGEFLRGNMPKRVFPSGEIYSYSNWGYSLLGLIVENVSGTDFSEYVRLNVLEPAGMLNSGLLAETGGANRATNYIWNDGWVRRTPDRFHLYPAGSLAVTGADMARFMVALLEHKILQPETLEMMFEARFAHHRDLQSAGLGVMIHRESSPRAVYHDGFWRGNTSCILLLPEKGIGVFVVCNFENSYMLTSLRQTFLGSFFPDHETESEATISRNDGVAGIAGHYRHVRYPRNSVDKLAVLVGTVPELIVKVDKSEEISVSGRRYEATSDGLLISKSGRPLAFRTDDRGKVVFLFDGLEAYERVSWIRSSSFSRVYLAATLVLFLFVAAAWLLVPAIRRKEEAGGSAIKRFAGSIAALKAIFLLGMATALLSIDPLEFFYGVPAYVKLLLLLPPLGAACSIAFLTATVISINRFDCLRDRLMLAMCCLAFLAFTGFTWEWSLLGFWLQ